MTVANWDSNLPLEPLLNQVDTALYQAKSQGRNCVLYTDIPNGTHGLELNTVAV
jgi:PleD family two-component response regulator